MSISVYFIQGDKKSICRNDAYSVVNDADNSLLEIVPKYELEAEGKTPADLKAAFQAAFEAVGTGNNEKLVAIAHHHLAQAQTPTQPRP